MLCFDVHDSAHANVYERVIRRVSDEVRSACGGNVSCDPARREGSAKPKSKTVAQR
jgi:hypothetical protein